MESKKINQLATELTPALSDLTIIGDPTTGISKKITLSQMANLFTGTVEEYPNLASFPLVGTGDTIYIALDTNILYRWDTTLTSYVELSPNIVTSLVFSDANGFDGTISLVGSTATLTITTALTQGSVPFIGTSGALSQDNANLFFDDSNNRLGINTNAPTTALDVFGSGIIGRLNGTSTNNSFLGFASGGTNQWSIGNVQSDHRFRIYSEANTAELVSVLQTGEFGIGIANPLTKLHIFGGASALIANLDANTSVAKSISFRSGNSSRINLEVSGTESGSNAGMDFYLRAYTDAGALLSTPLTISRSTGAATFSSSITATGATLTSTQTNLVLNTTTNTSFTKLSFQENGSEKATITYPNSTFGAPTRREKLEISNLGGINFITQNAPLTPNVSITSAGNVGIGVTPSASDTFPALQIGRAGFMGAGNDVNVSSNGFYSSPSWKYIASDSAGLYNISGNVHTWNTAASGTANNAISWNERMRITASGSVGININNPLSILDIRESNRTNGSNITNLGIYTTSTQAADSGGTIGFGGLFNGSEYAPFGSIRGGKENSTSGNYAGYLSFQTIPNNSVLTERMRITSAGNVGIGTTTAGVKLQVNDAQTGGGTGVADFFNTSSADNAPGITITKASATTSSSARFVQFYASSQGTAMGGIVGNGASNVQFASLSDIREKENITSISGSLNKILSLNPVEFDWIKTGEHINAGFVAQQVEEIFPEYVVENMSNDNEEARKGLTGGMSSGIIAHLVKAIQEQQAQIEELKALINK